MRGTWILAGALAITACGGGGEPDGEDSGAPDGGAPIDAADPADAGAPDGGSEDAGPRSARFRVNVAQSDGTTPIAGATVCVLGATPARCGTSDATGVVSVDVPVGGQVTLLFDAPGYRGFAYVFEPSADIVRWTLAFYTLEEDEAFFAPAGGIAAGEAQATMLVDADGVRFEVLEPAGAPVYYGSTELMLDPSLDATVAGVATVAGLAPGRVRIRDLSAHGCRPRFGGLVEDPAATAPVVSFTVVADRENRIDLGCGRRGP